MTSKDLAWLSATAIAIALIMEGSHFGGAFFFLLCHYLGAERE